jgi:hypothetical protein
VRAHHRIPAGRTNWRYFRLRCFAEGLSKAQVARFVEAKDGLSTERIYIVRTPLRGMIDGIVRRDGEALVRAGAIAAGLAITVVGYATGTIKRLVVCEAGNESVSENVKSSLPAEGLPIR